MDKVPVVQELLMKSRQYQGFGTLRPAPSTEFRGGSCCASHFLWGAIFAFLLPGGSETYSKTPTKSRDNVRDKVRYTVENPRIQILRAEDPEILPGSILSQDGGF